MNDNENSEMQNKQNKQNEQNEQDKPDKFNNRFASELIELIDLLDEKDDKIDFLKLEEFIDKAIEIEDYELLDLLLDKRGKVLPTLAEELFKEIIERDKKRQEILQKKFEEFKNILKQVESGKKFVQSYIQQEDKGNLINGKG